MESEKDIVRMRALFLFLGLMIVADDESPREVLLCLVPCLLFFLLFYNI